MPVQSLATALLCPRLSDRLLVPEQGPRKCASVALAKVSGAGESAKGVGAPGIPSGPWSARNTPSSETPRALLTCSLCFVPDPLPGVVAWVPQGTLLPSACFYSLSSSYFPVASPAPSPRPLAPFSGPNNSLLLANCSLASESESFPNLSASLLLRPWDQGLSVRAGDSDWL